MRISIWDMDWYYKQQFIPNYKVQKISSFHKQKGDFINFITEDSHFSFDYDIMYIVREIKTTPFPPQKFIDKKNVKMLGKEFSFYDNQWQLTPEMEMVRPDYMLYEVPENNAYANAHVVQLLHGTKFLPVWQDPVNSAAKNKQKTLLVDDRIWDLSDKDLDRFFDEVSIYKNIAFLHMISLKRAIQFWHRFKALHYSSGTMFKFKNDYGSGFEEVSIIIDLIEEFKAAHPHIRVDGFPIKTVMLDHWEDKENGIKDLERLLRIMDYAKQKKVFVNLKTPNNRHSTPYWFFFDMMELWSKQSPELSYIEIMTISLTERTGIQWLQVLSDSSKWSVPRIDFLLHIMIKYPHTIKYMARKWGDNLIDINLIDFTQIVKHINYYDREEALKKIEQAIARGENI